MDVEITKLDGTSFRLSEHDIVVQDFNVGSVPVAGIYGTIEGRAGTVDYGAEYGQRQITVPFYTKAADMGDYALLRDELYSLVISREPFYVRELRRLRHNRGRNRFVGGKRYLVRVSGEFTLDQAFRYGFGEMVLETVEHPFAESIGTTQDIQRDGIDSEDGLWGFGMGLIADDDSLIYTHASNYFRIFNAGDEVVHPFEHDLIITIDEVSGSTDFLELNNKSTGDRFRINGRVSTSDVIKLDGPLITSNGLQYFRQTNKKYITIKPGWNEFTVGGATSARVSFDFRFYYR